MGKKDLSLLQKPTHTGILEETTPEEKTAAPKQAAPNGKKQKTTGRPTVEEKRNLPIRTYLTKAEKAKLIQKMKEIAPSGIELSEAQFLRKVLIDSDLI